MVHTKCVPYIFFFWGGEGFFYFFWEGWGGWCDFFFVGGGGVRVDFFCGCEQLTKSPKRTFLVEYWTGDCKEDSWVRWSLVSATIIK